jgi:hypothetical protein
MWKVSRIQKESHGGLSKKNKPVTTDGIRTRINTQQKYKDGNMALLSYPKREVLRAITVREGLQHEEKFIPPDAKVWSAEHLILAGFNRIEVTNFGNPKGMPPFKDADELMKRIRTSKKDCTSLKKPANNGDYDP